MKISMELFHQHMAIVANLPSTISHLYPLQVKNCDSNLRLVVDKDDNSKFRLEGLKSQRQQTSDKIKHL